MSAPDAMGLGRLSTTAVAPPLDPPPEAVLQAASSAASTAVSRRMITGLRTRQGTCVTPNGVRLERSLIMFSPVTRLDAPSKGGHLTTVAGASCCTQQSRTWLRRRY